MFKKLFFGLVAALLFSSAQAQIAPTSQVRYNCGYAPGYHDTVEAALQGWGGMGAPNVSGPYVYSAGSCIASINGNPSVISSGSLQTVDACPANSSLSSGQCFCNSGYTQSGSVCVSNQCPVGQGRTFNRTEGWARSSNADRDDLVVSFGAPSSIYDYNDGACVGNISGVERCWRSQEPSSQGLYRTSCDYTMVISGDAPPSTGDDAADPTTSIPPCPGVVGTVNDKPLCVGTASNPLPSPSVAPNFPTGAGNPSAGGKPATGEGSGSTGSGRTPSTGSGGNDGGPASAAVGRGGTGERGEPGEDGTAVCGAAPLPPCAVKVDESGTPAEATAEGRFSQANTDLGKVQTDAQGAFGDIEDITLPSWTWTFAFPTGCTPLVLPAFDDFEIDVCQFQPIIHDLMSVIWVIAGIWGLIALFRNATGV